MEFAGKMASAPGLIDTPVIMDELTGATFTRMVREHRLPKQPGLARDLGGLVHFLCSDESAFIAGETMLAGGGLPRHA